MGKLISTSFLIVLLSFLGLPSYAADYDHVFDEVTSVYSIFDAKSPFRNGSTELFPAINSKNNQPRGTGTNPHRGTDIDADNGTPVYSIGYAKVTNISNNGQDSYVITQLDIDHNGTYDSYYVQYQHITPRSGMAVNDVLTPSLTVGTILDYSPAGNSGDHLHLESCNSSGAITKKLCNFYIADSQWNYGKHFDYLSNYYINPANSINITGYVMSDGTKYSLQNVKIYYKVGSSGIWSGPATLSKSGDNYTISLKTVSGAVAGQMVYFYLTGARSDAGYSGSYKDGFWKQYYSHPTAPLTSTYANTIAQSYVIQ